MKKIFLIIGFLAFIISYSYSQQKNLFKPIAGPDEFIVMNDSMKAGLIAEYSSLIHKVDSISSLNTSRFPSREDLNETSQKPVLRNNMPCIEIKGNFTTLVIKPDTTIKYSLLIRKP
jgi:hypothetical protein